MQSEQQLLTEVEQELKKKFDKDAASKRQTPTNAENVKSSARLNQLVLADADRPAMPLTKDKYLVRENEALVDWERETRKFLRNLSPEHGHRIAATMVYEWATGITVKDAMAAKDDDGPQTRVRADLRKINKILLYYFGKPYMTYIAGRKVPRCYRVRPGYYIRRHRPMTLTLWVEYRDGTLYP